MLTNLVCSLVPLLLYFPEKQQDSVLTFCYFLCVTHNISINFILAHRNMSK